MPCSKNERNQPVEPIITLLLLIGGLAWWTLGGAFPKPQIQFTQWIPGKLLTTVGPFSCLLFLSGSSNSVPYREVDSLGHLGNCLNVAFVDPSPVEY